MGRSVMESAGVTGEKAMHTADRTVNSAAETTKNISDKMIHEAEDKVDDKTTHQPTDSSAEDVRTREQEYDKEDHVFSHCNSRFRNNVIIL
ncbi:hypothetical protein DCAR_0519581 [Daucus carota subsp. sativus]|uniref:Uncharacterized protein n=1 Tax=Daucus carota subsp. sativus TaxID=79200 RepID=A0A164Y2F0_DAUCS|nr:hypothetical protein DCAR_0519581 [Daucus carota subsp. sativus]